MRKTLSIFVGMAAVCGTALMGSAGAASASPASPASVSESGSQAASCLVTLYQGGDFSSGTASFSATDLNLHNNTWSNGGIVDSYGSVRNGCATSAYLWALPFKEGTVYRVPGNSADGNLNGGISPVGSIEI